MAQVLSHPFRLLPNGRAATVEQTSPTAAAESIAMLALTRFGERRLAAGYGTPDPTFGGFSPTDLAAAIAAWGPNVTLDETTIEAVGDDAQRVHVRFT